MNSSARQYEVLGIQGWIDVLCPPEAHLQAGR